MELDDDEKEANCQKYDFELNCIQCEANYFIDEDGKCVTTCPTGGYNLIRYSKEGKLVDNDLKIVFDGLRECLEDNTDNKGVLIAGFDLSLTNEDKLYTPLKCLDGLIPVVYTEHTEFSSIDPSNSFDLLIDNIMVKRPGIAICKVPTNDSPIINNCDYYAYIHIKGKLEIRCLKCAQRYSSVISKEQSEANSSTPVSYFIEQCNLDSTCESTFKEGLDLIWIKFFSCHVCKSTSQIPFLAVTHHSSTNPIPINFNQYSLTSVNHLDDLNDARKNIECFEDSIETFGYDLDNDNQKAKYQELPENCALGVINLSVTDGDSTDNREISSSNSNGNLAQYCAACKPGYKSTNIKDNYPHIKIRCDRIDRCVGVDWFNHCSKCEVGHVWGNDGNIDTTDCVPYSGQNCLSANDQGICQTCLKGYNLNKDFICELMNPSNCKSSDYFSFKKEYTNKSDIIYGLYHDYRGVGCSECSNGYTSVGLSDTAGNPNICINSLYLQTLNNVVPDGSNYIKNCMNYGLFETKIICSHCISGWVLNSEKNTCYEGPTGCEVAESANKCILCQVGFSLVNNLCEQGNITNCLEFNRQTNDSTSRCLACEVNHYLTTQFDCKPGAVLNCAKYENFNPRRCDKCLEGFSLFKGQLDYCYKIDDSLNCKDAIIRSSAVFGAEVECTVCNKPFELLSNLSTDIAQKTICMEFQEIPNCVGYSTGENLSNSNFSCSLCDEGFYLSTPVTCTKRSNTSVLCFTYNRTEDKCLLCLPVAFNDSGNCVQSPNGINGCVSYSDLSTCDKCAKDKYLENNTCLEVPSENKIAGCEFYATSSTCSECLSGYFLSGTDCELAGAKNCLTYASVNACETCPPGFGLSQVDDKTNCIIVSKSNCLEYEPTGTFPCIKCNSSHFIDENGNCKAASPQIASCDEYVDNDNCKACKKGFALNEDGKSCVPLSSITNEFDGNCDDYKNQIECSICRPGSYFEGTSCLDCENSLACFKCNPLNPTRCVICQSGYYMDENFNCIKIQGTTPPIDNDFNQRLLLVSMFILAFFNYF